MSTQPAVEGKHKAAEVEERREIQALERAKNIVSALEGFTVLPVVGPIDHYFDRRQFEGAIDHVYLSSHCAHKMKEPKLKSLVRPTGAVSVELAKHIVPLSKAQDADYTTALQEMAAENGFLATPERARPFVDTMTHSGQPALPFAAVFTVAPE